MAEGCTDEETFIQDNPHGQLMKTRAVWICKEEINVSSINGSRKAGYPHEKWNGKWTLIVYKDNCK